ncbi:hypothetical protein N9R53_07340 [Flavobacteriaceae bacterium]|nr:hypothetical protein [Flavobacteriaceae bacterium]
MKTKNTHSNKNLSRKEALKKIGKYTALTAVGTLIILNPQKAQALSGPGDNPGGGFGMFD